jgi:hypothetical protein
VWTLTSPGRFLRSHAEVIRTRKRRARRPKPPSPTPA